MNSFMQMLFRLKTFKNAIFNMGSEEKIIYELQR